MNPYIVLVPGLRRSENSLWSQLQNQAMRWIIQHRWHAEGEIYLFGWLAPQDAFDEEMTRLRLKVEQLISSGHRVVLVGASGGVSIVLNLFMTCPNVERVVCIDGRVREGNHSGRRSLDSAAAHNPIFKESVLRCEEGLKNLEAGRLESILTLVSPWDEIVPVDTAVIEGAKNVKVWCVGHILSIFVAMWFRRWTILKFIA